jgi:hypothetical protein
VYKLHFVKTHFPEGENRSLIEAPAFKKAGAIVPPGLIIRALALSGMALHRQYSPQNPVNLNVPAFAESPYSLRYDTSNGKSFAAAMI